MVLHENFNSSNQTSPHFEPHQNYVSAFRLPSCSLIILAPPSEKCNMTTQQLCTESESVINYLRFFYCNFNTLNRLSHLFGVTMMIIWVGIYFWMFGMIMGNYFIASLKTLTHMMNFNEYVAGVTILAAGNCAPDFFLAFASLHSTVRQTYTDTFSSNLFISLFISGLVIVIHPFAIEAEHLLRDTGFLLLSVTYVDFIVKTKSSISVFRAFGTFFIYFLYLVVVFVDNRLSINKQKELEKEVALTGSEKIKWYLNRLKAKMAIKKSVVPVTSDDSMLRNEGLWIQFFRDVNPFDYKKFSQRSHIVQLIMILRIPLALILRLFIPYVDVSMENYGWSKLLFCINIVITPTCVILNNYYTPITGLVVFLPSLFIAIIVFAKTRTYPEPKYYKYCSVLCCIFSTFFIFYISKEMLALLDSLGLVMNTSDALVGATVLSYGTSLGDLFSNVLLTLQGLPRMAFAGCFGGPIFNTVCSIGMPLIILALNSDDGTASVTEGTMGENSSIFLIIGLFSIVLYSITTNFMLRRSCGIFNLMLYGMFLMSVILADRQIIHAYGTDHSIDKRF